MKKYIQVTMTCLIAFCVGSAFIAFAEEKEHDHDHEHHHHKEAGPNGGRLLCNIEPHLEFKVTKDRKVTITALSEELKPVAIGEMVVRVTAGDRSAPIRMSFKKEGEILVSDKAFPKGDDFPVVVQIKVKGSEKSIIEKFTMDFSQCPTCVYLEYACICDHGHDHDHDNKDEKKK